VNPRRDWPHRQEDEPLCKSGMVQGKHRQERWDQEPGGTRNPETTKGWGRLWKGPERNNSIRDQGLRQQLQGTMRIKYPGTKRQLRLKIERTSDRIDWKAVGLELVKRAHGLFSGLRKVTDWTVCRDRCPAEREYKVRTLWRGRSPPKRKKNLLALLVKLA
jgi:hypothetical protein